MFSYQQVSNEEPEEDQGAPPSNPPDLERGVGNLGNADDPEAEIPANPSREFLKFANQALQLNVSFIFSRGAVTSWLVRLSPDLVVACEQAPGYWRSTASANDDFGRKALIS